jgi:hypothetical protein
MWKRKEEKARYGSMYIWQRNERGEGRKRENDDELSVGTE